MPNPLRLHHSRHYWLNLQRYVQVRDDIFLGLQSRLHLHPCIDSNLGADVGPDPNEIVSKSSSSAVSAKVC